MVVRERKRFTRPTGGLSNPIVQQIMFMGFCFFAWDVCKIKTKLDSADYIVFVNPYSLNTLFLFPFAKGIKDPITPINGEKRLQMPTLERLYFYFRGY